MYAYISYQFLCIAHSASIAIRWIGLKLGTELYFLFAVQLKRCLKIVLSL